MGKQRDFNEKNNNNNRLNLIEIEPLTDNQERAFEYWDNGKHLVMYGFAGSGKTFLSLAMAFEEVRDKNSFINKVVLIRSAVPSRDMGYLPGSATEKASAYEEPYEKMVNTLFGRGDAYTLCKKAGELEFRTTSYMRGLTLDRSVVIIDECQSMNDGEFNTIFTRFGDDSRFILCGDFRQNDLKKEQSGMAINLNILRNINSVGMVEFGIQDIVRSKFVKSYIIEREKQLSKKPHLITAA